MGSKKTSEECLLLFKALVDLTDNHVFLFQKWPVTDITKSSLLLSDQILATISMNNLSLMTSAKVKTKTTRKSTPTTSSLVWNLLEKKLQRQLTNFNNKKLTTEQRHHVVAPKMFFTTLPEIMYILILVQLSLKQNSIKK